MTAAAAQCRVLFVSGGVDAAGADEAAVMRDYLISRGVPADRIVADSAGVDTWATARHATPTCASMAMPARWP